MQFENVQIPNVEIQFQFRILLFFERRKFIELKPIKFISAFGVAENITLFHVTESNDKFN